MGVGFVGPRSLASVAAALALTLVAAACGSTRATTRTVTVTNTVVQIQTVAEGPPPRAAVGKHKRTQARPRRSVAAAGTTSTSSAQTTVKPTTVTVTARSTPATHMRTTKPSRRAVPKLSLRVFILRSCRAAPEVFPISGSGAVAARQLALQLLPRVAALQHALAVSSSARFERAGLSSAQLGRLTHTLNVLREDLAVATAPHGKLPLGRLQAATKAEDASARQVDLASCAATNAAA
jgi:hypothetical protein